jgi:uncharacterized membrane protein YfcA
MKGIFAGRVVQFCRSANYESGMQNLIPPDCLYAVSGFFVGVLVGMTGVGGGSLLTPLLILLFGVHPTTAVGTDLLFATSTKATGTIVHSAARTVDWKLVSLLAIGSVPATISTILVLSHFDLKSATAQHVVTIALGCVLLITALFLIAGRMVRQRYAARLNAVDRRTAGLLTIVLGLAMGVLVTATSIGAGAIGVTILLILHPKMVPGRVVGSDIAHAVPLTLLAGAGHWYLGSVDWTLLGNLLIGSIPGIILGSYVTTRARDGVVRVTLASVLVIVGVRLLA